MSPRRFVKSFNSAIEGFVYVLKTQRNMRLHFYLAVLIIIMAVFLFSRQEVLILSCAVCLVLMAEMVNTACELIVDMITDSFHPVAKVIKDVSAGAVFLASLNAVVVGYLIFYNYLPLRLEGTLDRLRNSPWHMAFITTLMVMTLVVTTKISFKKGTPLRGGMPSGHAALAFSCWAIIMALSANAVVVILSFLMAVLIAASRVRRGIHTIVEVVIGSLAGIIIASLFFGVLK